MAVVVKIPTQLRTLTDGRDQVEADGHSLQQVLDALENAHPGLQKRVLDDAGELRRFVNVYVDDVRYARMEHFVFKEKTPQARRDLALDVDLLCPSALENAIDEDNAGDVRAKAVFEVANGPVTSAARGEETAVAFRPPALTM